MDQSIRKNDVLLGRGGLTNNNNGNIQFREIIASKQLQYLDSKKREKKAIAEACVATVHGNGGRFLKKDDASGLWAEVPLKKAVTKASQALREGLDVRHKRLREGKGTTRPLSESGNDRKKRQKVATGTVATATTSPALVSLHGEENNVPELKEELSAKTFYAPPPVSTKDCDNVAEI